MVACAAVAATALLGRAGNDFLYARQLGGQCLAAWMFASLLVRCGRQRFAFALGGHFLAADAGFQLQQLQLQIAQTLAARTVLGDALETQPLFQHLDLLLCRT